jgi:hypothetical protein
MSRGRWCCGVALAALVLVLALGAWVVASLAHIESQSAARGNPVNRLIAHSIVPRALGMAGRWEPEELPPRVRRLVEELTVGGLWRELRNEHAAWVQAHKVQPL